MNFVAFYVLYGLVEALHAFANACMWVAEKLVNAMEVLADEDF